MDDNSHAADVLRKLQSRTLANTPRFTLIGKYKCKVFQITDGDTFKGAVEFCGECYTFTFRIFGINTPELKPRLTIADRLNTIRKARAAKAKLAELLVKDKICDVEVVGLDAFGRALVKVTCDGRSVGDQLLEGGFAETFPFTKRAIQQSNSIVRI